ncbi:hypothetical protein TNCV_3640221 [Trichonephila clavipes]|nr:hypothetical protein TNCV_3640221 [Trichonephila clavipes]
MLVDNSIWWQVKTADCDKARVVNSHGYSLQRGTEWESTRRNTEGCKNTYASGHRGSLRVFPHATIPTYLCFVTRLQESLLKCYAYWMILTYDVFCVICMRSIATTVPRNQGSYFLGELGGRGAVKGLSDTCLKSASKRLSSSSDARPMT